MSISNPTTSFRWPLELKASLELWCKRHKPLSPGVWMAQVATEQLTLLLGRELFESVGFCNAYQALQEPSWSSCEEEEVGHDLLNMVPQAKARYTPDERRVFEQRLLDLLDSVGFQEVGRRIRFGFLKSYQSQATGSSADQRLHGQHPSTSVNTGRRL